MNVKIIALGAALAAAALPSPADAGCRGCGVAAGVVGGLAAGAIIGSALAGPRYAEPAPPPVYYAPEPAYVAEEPACHVERQRFWDGYSWRHRRVEVCD
ncbi:MAG TPA: hypothetical protein VFC54_04225 [Pseudolabrys sp.]|nr:hypothetical protein [Pseudolabrys sp.]